MDKRLDILNRHISEGIIPNPIIDGCQVSHIYIDPDGRSVIHITHKENDSRMHNCFQRFRRTLRFYDCRFFVIFFGGKLIIRINKNYEC